LVWVLLIRLTRLGSFGLDTHKIWFGFF